MFDTSVESCNRARSREKNLEDTPALRSSGAIKALRFWRAFVARPGEIRTPDNRFTPRVARNPSNTFERTKTHRRAAGLSRITRGRG
jgi:hypothetical protein